MKKLELYPTKENLIDTFLKDSIGRNSDVCYFVSLIDSIEDSFSLAVNGNWGSGKTFFIKHAEMIFSARNKFYKYGEFVDNKEEINQVYEYFCNNSDITPIKNLIIPVYYDSWKYDNDDDPILSIIYEIISTLDNEEQFEKNISPQNTLVGLTKAIAKIDLKDVINEIKGEDDFIDLKKSRNIKERVDNFFNEIFAERGDKIVIFIDELDRCKPTYAIKLLERVKHYFNHDKVVFVFATNLEELQHSVKSVYGSDFSAFKYLDRFF